MPPTASRSAGRSGRSPAPACGSLTSWRPTPPRRARRRSHTTSWSSASWKSSRQRSWKTRRRRPDAAPAQHAEDDAAGPEDAAGDDGRARVAEGRAGGGVRGRRDGQGRRHRRAAHRVDHDRPRRGRPRGRRDAAGHRPRRGQRGAALRAGGRRRQDGRRDRRPRRPGRRTRRPGLARLVSTLPRSPSPAARHRAGQAARHRQPPRAAARVPHPPHLGGGRERARRGDPRREGEDQPLRGLLQPRRGPALRDLPGRAPRPHADLRGGGARRRHPGRADPRVPRALPRARRRAVADRRRRARRPQDRPALLAGRGRRDPRGRARHESHDHRRGDRAAHRRRPPPPRARRRGHPPRLRPPGRRRPRVRRRSDARPSPRRPKSAVNSTVVMKFGGTSVADAESLKRAARRIVRAREQGHHVVAVLSARGSMTDELVAMAEEVSPTPDPREMDMLLSTGERMSCALAAMAINDLGHKAISLTGSQAGIVTDTSHTKARILDVRANRIREALDNEQIVLVAGFQGVSTAKDVTTLGRGGSDTTAGALAAAMDAEVCEIYTDVAGVFSADPRIVPDARKLPVVSFEEMLEMAASGARVLQLRSVEYARTHGVRIHCRSSFSEDPGTFVVGEEETMERPLITAVTHSTDEARVTLLGVPDNPGIAGRIFTALADANVNVDMIIQNEPVGDDELADLSFTVDRSDLTMATDTIAALGGLSQ